MNDQPTDPSDKGVFPRPPGEEVPDQGSEQTGVPLPEQATPELSENPAEPSGDLPGEQEKDNAPPPSGELPATTFLQQPSSIRLVATLTAAGLISGLILVGVYLLTSPQIEQNRVDAVQSAVKRIFPRTERIAAYVLRGEQLVPFEGEEGAVPTEEAMFAAYDRDETLVGYAIPGRGNGFMDTIDLLYGYDPARQLIVGLEILDSRETPGLGDRIGYDPDWLASFQALAVRPRIVGVKDERDASNEVDVITGATISSQTVIRILNESNRRFLPLLPQNRDSQRD